ncbi:MAG: prepilin-type N-terminal cleavage/methylation domain-containing protein [Candidatus Sulfotelmatobacter sp.]
MMLKKQFVGRHAREDGFTLIELLAAVVVMTIGLLALMATFATTIRATESAQENLIARHKALDAMESIYTARNSQQEPFAAINNIANGGIFKAGAQPLLCAGPDGIVGTADDVACTAPDTGVACPGGVECLVLPGPDGILGTADDVTYSLSNFTRTITFAPTFLPSGAVNTNLIAVSVTVSYTKPGQQSTPYAYTVNGLVSSYH